MHNLSIAEWTLSLVTSRGRASSTVGDLAEQAVVRGRLWFWSGVLRTAASLLYREVSSNLGRMAGVACLGMAVYFGLDLLSAGIGGIAFFVAALSSGHAVQLSFIGWKLWFAGCVLLPPLVVGRLLARWAPEREMAAAVTYTLIAAIVALVSMSIFPDGSGPADLLSRFVVSLGIQTPVLAGAAWGRRRALRAT